MAISSGTLRPTRRAACKAPTAKMSLAQSTAVTFVSRRRADSTNCRAIPMFSLSIRHSRGGQAMCLESGLVTGQAFLEGRPGSLGGQECRSFVPFFPQVSDRLLRPLPVVGPNRGGTRPLDALLDQHERAADFIQLPAALLPFFRRTGQVQHRPIEAALAKEPSKRLGRFPRRQRLHQQAKIALAQGVGHAAQKQGVKRVGKKAVGGIDGQVGDGAGPLRARGCGLWTLG